MKNDIENEHEHDKIVNRHLFIFLISLWCEIIIGVLSNFIAGFFTTFGVCKIIGFFAFAISFITIGIWQIRKINSDFESLRNKNADREEDKKEL
jgi:hypothetical protein